MLLFIFSRLGLLTVEHSPHCGRLTSWPGCHYSRSRCNQLTRMYHGTVMLQSTKLPFIKLVADKLSG